MPESASMFDYIVDIIETVLLILERPVVWRQLFVFAVITILAWLTHYAGLLTFKWFYERPFTISPKVDKPPQTEEESAQTAPADNQQPQASGRSNELLQKLLFRLRAIRFTIYPILCIAWGELFVALFAWNGWLYGLLERLNGLFVLLLAYNVAVAVLHSILTAGRARIYNRRFVTPLFLLILFALSNDVDGGTFATRELVLFRLLDTEITIGRLLTALLTFYLFLTFAWIVRDIFETFILPRTRAATDDERGLGHMIVGASYYAIVAMGILIGFGIAGFNMSALAVIFGGLSVGIGFGLQDLVANFVSGILLLFGQTLRPGDVVEIGGRRGTVEKMSIRATVVQGIDNVETFVPNKTLLTSQFSTYNYTSPISRHALTVTASYDSDPSLVRSTLVKLAERHGLVLKKPAPTVFFNDFGDSALEFELAVHLDKPARAKEVLSDLRFMIWQEFRKMEIEIPFPQRDVYVRDWRGGDTDEINPVVDDHKELA